MMGLSLFSDFFVEHVFANLEQFMHTLVQGITPIQPAGNDIF